VAARGIARLAELGTILAGGEVNGSFGRMQVRILPPPDREVSLKWQSKTVVANSQASIERITIFAGGEGGGYFGRGEWKHSLGRQ